MPSIPGAVLLDHGLIHQVAVLLERPNVHRRSILQIQVLTKLAEFAQPGPRWLAEKPPYGTAEAERWERRRNGLVARTAKDVRREIEAEEEHKTAEYGAWQDRRDSDLDSNSSKEQEQDQQESSSDRDTHFNPGSSPKLPADLDADTDRTAQAEFEEAVADGSYFAGPDFEWEPGDEGS